MYRHKSFSRKHWSLAFFAALVLLVETASAVLVVNPPLPITHRVSVQIIETALDNGTSPATIFGNATQQANIEQQIDTIWAQAGIDIEFLPAVVRYDNSFAYQGNLPPDQVRPLGDFTQILLNAGTSGVLNSEPSVINMLFVNVVPGFEFTDENTANGLANIGNDGITQFVGDNLLTFQNGIDVIASVVAHEIGHNLGLKHTGNNLPNLMSPSTNPPGMDVTTEQLSTEQIAALFQTTFRDDAVAFIPNGGTGFPQPIPPSAERAWAVSGSGGWSVAANWSPAAVPNANTDVALFGDAINAAATVAVDASFTVKEMRFDNANSYTLQGTGTITMDADAGVAALDVNQGTHIVDANVALADDTTVSVAAGGQLRFENPITLAGHTMTLANAGTVTINGSSGADSGTLNVASGTLGGNGTVGGDVNNNAVVSPGNSAGMLTINGNYAQTSGQLTIEIGGTTSSAEHDVLAVGGNASLGGMLNVELIDAGNGPFSPALGDSFTFLTATGGVSGHFDVFSLPALAGPLHWQLIEHSAAQLLAIGLAGDYNLDGVVNAADYTVVRDSLGSTTAIGAGADGNSDGVVTVADIDVWRQNFGSTGSSAAVAAGVNLPEPCALTLLLVGIALAARRRHR